MNILGIDTSTKTMSLALMSKGLLTCEMNFASNMDHSDKLMDNISYMLETSHVDIGDIDLYGVAIGPGSFTGIRVAIATVKGLNEFANKPVAAISSLKVLAKNLESHDRVAVAIDAKRDRVYGYVVDNKSKKEVLEEGLYDIKDFKTYLDSQTIVTGDMAEALGHNKIALKRDLLNSAANLCSLAQEAYDKKETISHLDLQANYMTKSQAEIDFKRRNKLE